MGGYGSGRWGTGKSDAKTLVSSCHALNLDSLARQGIVGPDLHHRASWDWLGRSGEEAVASIGLEVRTDSNLGTVRLQYRTGGSEGFANQHDYPIELSTTRLPSGGLRWWFRCGASRKGGPSCGKRVRMLYLPPRGRVFACRGCHELAYESSRDSRKYGSLFGKIGAEMGLDGRAVEKILRRQFNPATDERWGDGVRGRIDCRLASKPQSRSS